MITTTDATDTAAPSGVDLARAALQAARTAAAAKAQRPKPKRRTGASASRQGRDGRDPLTFADAIKRLMAERGWDMSAAGGTIRDRWSTIAPTLKGKVGAERYDEETRTLYLRPVSPAYRTQLAIHQREIIQQVNEAVGEGTVIHLKILAPGAVDVPDARPAAPASPRPPAPAAQPEPPRPKHPGYLATLDAHRSAGGTHEAGLAPLIRAAAEEQTQALRRHREPEAVFTEIATRTETRQDQHHRTETTGTLEESIRAALVRKRRSDPAPPPAATSGLSQAS
ncbi:DciA family protein [Streptomyces sp. NPDC050204]|uniref:DciA family protein n=1 Tax=Streptomyces sp. NPDC050204 TaxID=3155514 RepID=UPI003419F2C3